MQIETGKFYRARCGAKVGPMRFRDWNKDHPWESDGDDVRIWDARGRRFELANEPDFDLVSEWTESPVRTVTRKEIVPGEYGIVTVFVDNTVHIPCASKHTAEELRAAARVFNELADALDVAQ